MPLIDSTAALEEVIGRALATDAVAVDTEFVWERTYYPRLGLIQIAFGLDEVHLIDAPAVDLAPLGTLLADASVTKILHDAGQDLTILSRETGSKPRNTFDTQLAAGFVGLTSTLSLQALVAEVTGVHLPKGVTRSDWLQRPLTDEQLEYARADVRHLVEVFERLEQRLQEAGRLEWAREELQQYDDPEQFEEDDPRRRYRQTKGRGKRGFTARDYSVLRELTAWREIEARERDRPRGHVITDDALVEIASRKPTSTHDLARIRSLPAPVRERHASALLLAVERGLAVPRDEWPDRPDRQADDPSITPRLDLVQAILRGHGERDGVDPQLVANRAEVERLVSTLPPNPEEHSILTGWRRVYIGADLEMLLAGKAAVELDERGLPRIIHSLG
jgi:ribonuclease D